MEWAFLSVFYLVESQPYEIDVTVSVFHEVKLYLKVNIWNIQKAQNDFHVGELESEA